MGILTPGLISTYGTATAETAGSAKRAVVTRASAMGAILRYSAWLNPAENSR